MLCTNCYLKSYGQITIHTDEQFSLLSVHLQFFLSKWKSLLASKVVCILFQKLQTKDKIGKTRQILCSLYSTKLHRGLWFSIEYRQSFMIRTSSKRNQNVNSAPFPSNIIWGQSQLPFRCLILFQPGFFLRFMKAFYPAVKGTNLKKLFNTFSLFDNWNLFKALWATMS